MAFSTVPFRLGSRTRAGSANLLDDLKALLTGDSPLPAVLVLDDAHWMDVRSLDFVERLLTAAHLGRWPLSLTH